MVVTRSPPSSAGHRRTPSYLQSFDHAAESNINSAIFIGDSPTSNGGADNEMRRRQRPGSSVFPRSPQNGIKRAFTLGGNEPNANIIHNSTLPPPPKTLGNGALKQLPPVRPSTRHGSRSTTSSGATTTIGSSSSSSSASSAALAVAFRSDNNAETFHHRSSIDSASGGGGVVSKGTARDGGATPTTTTTINVWSCDDDGQTVSRDAEVRVENTSSGGDSSGSESNSESSSSASASSSNADKYSAGQSSKDDDDDVKEEDEQNGNDDQAEKSGSESSEEDEAFARKLRELAALRANFDAAKAASEGEAAAESETAKSSSAAHKSLTKKPSVIEKNVEDGSRNDNNNSSPATRQSSFGSERNAAPPFSAGKSSTVNRQQGFPECNLEQSKAVLPTINVNEPSCSSGDAASRHIGSSATSSRSSASTTNSGGKTSMKKKKEDGIVSPSDTASKPPELPFKSSLPFANASDNGSAKNFGAKIVKPVVTRSNGSGTLTRRIEKSVVNGRAPLTLAGKGTMDAKKTRTTDTRKPADRPTPSTTKMMKISATTSDINKNGGFSSTIASLCNRGSEGSANSFDLWLQKKREVEVERLRREREKREEEERRNQEKRRVAEMSFERWKADRERRLVAERERKHREAEAQRRREEEARRDKQLNAEKTFEHWKKTRLDSQQSMRRRANSANSDVRQRRKTPSGGEDNGGTRKGTTSSAEAERAFQSWLNTKTERERDALRRKRAAEQEAAERKRQEREYKQQLSEQAYQLWLQMKREEQKYTQSLAYKILEFETEAKRRWPSTPWLPTGNSVPRHFAGSGDPRRRRMTLERPVVLRMATAVKSASDKRAKSNH